MHHEAHRLCFIANSVTTEVRCAPAPFRPGAMHEAADARPAPGRLRQQARRADADSLTRHQKDSIIGQSRLPGAGGVNGAMRP